MAAVENRAVRVAWPIAYGRRRARTASASVRLAWALFIGLGLPFVLMALLSILARAGIYVDLFRPLWQPWPPDLLKPFLGVAVFAATLAYLAYRVGVRSGFRTGTVAGIASSRLGIEERPRAAEPVTTIPATNLPVPPPVPPPPPDEARFDL